ncbi:MAG: HisA/HisF-related TIM barrel protein [Gammaproteobacteria bacterium]
MLLIPAIEIKDGKCVPAAGKPARGKTTQPDDPVEAAKRWIAAGARRLNVVDLDGLASGNADNAGVIRNMADACPGVPIQVSGGLRSDEIVENYFAAGAEYMILDTKSASAPHFVNNLCLEYPGHIMVALEAKDGKVAAEGWSKLAQHSVLDVAGHFQREGVAAILYSGRNGNQTGLDIPAALSLAQAMTVPVLVVGGLASFEDIRKLCKAGAGLSGAVLDTGFADDALDFVKAQKLADSLVRI